jgi:hypothetical protein
VARIKTYNVAAGEKPFRGAVRKRRMLVGLPKQTPVPISTFAARIQPQVGTVAKNAPSFDRAFKKWDPKVAGAI